MSELEGIAIIGVHGRFPGADSAEALWQILAAGRDTISFFSDEELARAGLDVRSLKEPGNYVPARGVMRDAECFDRDFFGIHLREAEVMDPQHRVFLEGCWEALERCGYAPGRIRVPVGIYCGATFNTYFMHALNNRPDLTELVGPDQVMFGNEKDYIATRAAYKLNLSGPAISLNTACSTSLTAVCQACQSLLTYQCDMAIAGGVSVTVPQTRGYHFQEGDIRSSDGHTRSFDVDASGTVFSNGLALLVLKRVDEALTDGDQIYGVIKGFALNNDGADRVSFSAPGVDGQVEVISMAQALAEVEPDDITYIEAHGTATPVGDPIEVAALTEAFRRRTSRNQFCAIGSVKTNIGHLDAAAGAAGLIKTVMALHHGQIPPHPHFKAPNPKLDLEHTPFYVNTTLQPWNREGDKPRLAGVSSFGSGGTNAHVIVEEAPAAEPSGPSRAQQLLLLSAKTAEALDRMKRDLLAHLRAYPEANLADVAFTLQTGRGEFVDRHALVCNGVQQACSLLESPQPPRVISARQEHKDPPVVFMFPGQGSQFAGMGADLYQQESVFRDVVDLCTDLLRPSLQEDLRHILFPASDQENAASENIRQTRFTQPALFVMEYALAKLWMSWGVKPTAMIGHSVGEYVAACLAGVLKLEDALKLIARRAELVQSMPPGSMLAVRLPEAEVRPYLNPKLAIGAVNSPELCVVAGPHESVDALAKQLEDRGVLAKRLRTSHAFHSPMMDPIVEPFTDVLRSVEFAAPTIPYVSNVTADWIQADEAMSPEYWAGHVRQAVRFSDGIEKLLQDPSQVLLEVGPGRGLSQLALQHRARDQSQRVITSLPYSRDPEAPGVLAALGSLWVAGVNIDWDGFYANEKRRRVVLPTYPFERTLCWPSTPASEDVTASSDVAKRSKAVTPTIPESSQQGESPLAHPNESAVAKCSRKDRLIAEICSFLTGLSGNEISAAEASVSLLELGFDSLLLTQVATQLQKNYRTKVTFRQLMEDLSTIEAIASHLDASMPAAPEATISALADPAVPDPAVPNPAAGASGSRDLRAVLERTSDIKTGHESEQDYAALLEQHLAVTAQLLSATRQRREPNGESQATGDAKAGIRIDAQRAAALGGAAPRASHGPYRPLDRSKSSSLSQPQKELLDAFITRYNQRTAGSKALAAKNRPLLADPRSVAGFKSVWKECVYPIHSVRSEGSRIWDVDGNEYVDFVMGFGASLFGHRPPFLVDAVKAQLDTGFETGPIHPMAGEVANLVQELTGAERVGFCSSGSEAVLAAIRVSRTVTGRDKIVIFEGAYHGIFDEVLARPIVRNGQLRSMPTAPGIPEGSVGEIIVLQYGNPASLEIIEQYGDEIAAVLVEPVQARRLDLVPKDFLLQLREITAATGTALVFDEVVTGFRIKPGGAQEYFGITADLATFGKVVGGGLPIGIVTGKARYMDALDGGPWQFGDDSAPEVGVTFFAGTFVRHPLALAAAKSVLTHLKQEGPHLQVRVAERAERVAKAFGELFAKYRAPYQLSHFSSLIYLSVPTEFTYGALLYCHLRDRGIHIFENRLFVFTTAHSDEDERRLLQAMDDSLKEMQRGGLLPGTVPVVESPETDRGADQSALAAPTTATANLQAELRLTQAQREIWLAAEMGEDAFRAYNTTFVMHMRGDLDRQALESALQGLVNRHDSLRAAFDLESPVQRFLPNVQLEIPFVDLSSLAEAAREERFSELAREQADRHFDIASPPLLRAQLVSIDSQENRLILSVSHMVADGWSSGVLLDELKSLYRAHRDGSASPLEPAMQFREYLTLLNTPQHHAAEVQAERYWQDKFAKLPTSVELPYDRHRPAHKTYTAIRESVVWDEEFTQQLRRASAQHRTTLLTFLLAGFKVLMHRLSGQEDLVVGIPAAGQIASTLESSEGGQALVGHCVNLLPVRSQCSPDQSFQGYLKSLKSEVLDACDQQSLTFSRLLELLNVPRESNRLPLVPIIFNLDRYSSGFALDGLETTVQEVSRSSIVFDIFCNVSDDDRRLHVNCEFNSTLFDATTIRRWLVYYRHLLAQAVENADSEIKRIDVLGDQERNRTLLEWNQTRRDYPSTVCVHHLFEQQAERTPDKTAIRVAGQTVTYADLDRRANQLARYLKSCGVGPEVLVGICTERSIDMVVGLLGILKAGGAYVPIDPAFPSDRIGFMLEDSAARLLVTQNSLSKILPTEGLKVVCLDTDEDIWSSVHDTSPNAESTEQNLAYVIFTSGSTGRPKGVQISHQALVNFLCSMQRTPGMSSDDVLLAVTTLSFDIAGLEIFLPLISGGTVEIVSSATAADAMMLMDCLEHSGATIMQATPATWRMLMEAGWNGAPNLKVLCGGEAMPRDLIDPLLGRCCQLWNMYGPTETTVWSSVERIVSSDGVISIGRPIDNTQMYVLDDQLQPVPLGVTGELYIGGDGLARGYLNRPELTEERFVPDPFNGNGQARIYNTGDLARFLSDSRLECLGRKDQQVKIRGYRIELGEIEAVLASHPAVRESAVIEREFAPGDVRLVAYVVYVHDAAEVPAELMASLREKLPDYMVPTSLVTLDQLPHTPNGKVDRTSLAKLQVEASRPDDDYQAPRDQIELHLSRLWEDLLDVRPVGVRDDFFHLGGHSLLGVQLMVQIEKVYGRRLPLATLLQARTVAGLAEIIRSENWRPTWDCLVPIRPGGSKPPLFLIHAAGGNVLIYQDLAEHLGDEQPVYGVQAKGLDGKQTPHTNVEEMATAYRQEIQKMQPRGPYLLGGYCLGGTIALEVATQLRERGEHVAFLGMLDAHNWANMKRPSLLSRCFYYLQKFDFHLRNLWRLGHEERGRFFRGKMSELKRRKAVWSDTIMPKKSKANRTQVNDRSLSAIWANNDRIAAEYRPRTYAGRITQFCPVRNYSELKRADVGWEEIAEGGVDVSTLPVYPAGMLMEPYVRQLASEMTKAIESGLMDVIELPAVIDYRQDLIPELEPVS